MKNVFKNTINEKIFEDLKAAGIEPLNVSRGNTKLVSNDETLFLIWNLPARKTCPGKTHECSAACYAIKAEILYKGCLPSRMKNFKESLKDDFVNRAIYTILKAIKYDKKHRHVVVRIHESGDFYNAAYAAKWLAIAAALIGENVTFICYTKSFSFFDGIQLPENFQLRASIWSDTPEKDLETIHRNGWNTYSAVEKFTDSDDFGHCRCEDCATCGKCWNPEYKAVCCEIH